MSTIPRSYILGYLGGLLAWDVGAIGNYYYKRKYKIDNTGFLGTDLRMHFIISPLWYAAAPTQLWIIASDNIASKISKRVDDYIEDEESQKKREKGRKS